MPRTSLWESSLKAPRFARLQKSEKFDVVIVGGGITGVTTGYLMKQAGLRVAVVERGRIGSVDTGHTTAHLTYVTDERLTQLAKTFGKDHAQATWDAGLAAIRQIDEIIQLHRIDCDFRWVPGYLHSPWFERPGDSGEKLKADAELAVELGFHAEYRDHLPWIERPGVLFPNQAKFQPLKYVSALAQLVDGDGSAVFEETEIDKFEDDPVVLRSKEHSLECDHVVIATHSPLFGISGLQTSLLQTKTYSYSSYAVAASLPKGQMSESIFWDISNPYYYFRFDQSDSEDYVILGGCDHKTGTEVEPAAKYQQLEEMLAMCLPQAKVQHRWTGRVIETNDGLPYIGSVSERQFVSTGFAGNGMTFGTLGGMLACDYVLGKRNPWQELFAPSRSQIMGGTWDYIKENLDYPYYMIKDRLASAEKEDLVQSLGKNEGGIFRINGKRVAVFRDSKGQLTHLSPICTHLGCHVRWNQDEMTWDCPCHGSRFKATGEVLAGPAEKGLAAEAS